MTPPWLSQNSHNFVHAKYIFPTPVIIMWIFRVLYILILTGTLLREASALAATAASITPAPVQVKNVLTKVAVAGATGKTGRLVVEELLRRDTSQVVAIVRDVNKAKEVFPTCPDNLEIIQCNLGDTKSIESALGGVDAVIWCATGFSDASPGPFEKVKQLFGIALAPKASIDAVGIPAMAACLLSQSKKEGLPKLVMLSAAGVTRPCWDEDKKQRFKDAAEIPIVRLNPFGILDVKRESEEKLRQSGVDYCIVRSVGLNDSWPAGSRPVFSQGDVAVGRINRRDVADILVDVLTIPEANGKTFEAIAIAGYPKAVSIGAALSRLVPDKDGPPSIESITATYTAMQQLIPGETQDPSALAMGQTYEELDEGKEGRLGKRGEENAENAAPKPSS
jgi:uncharacterized protein YbjT (DUF2867 family)